MKKLYLFLTFAIISGSLFAQDTLTGWTFPVNSGLDSLNANLGTTQNKGYDLRFQWVTPNDTTINSVFFTDGSTSYAAATTGWDNGTDNKYWSIKFKANNYSNIKVSSHQKSIYSTYAPGPADFKLQWKITGGTYEDVPGGTIHVSNDWTTGAVDSLAVPVTNSGAASVYIRWIATSDLDINGSALTANGINMIDDILVTGTSTLGSDDIIFTNRLNIYPVPNNGKFTVESKVPVRSLEVYDLSGKSIYHDFSNGVKFSINLGTVIKGTYILKIGFTDTKKTCSIKFLVD
jgi:hypothetical protein